MVSKNKYPQTQEAEQREGRGRDEAGNVPCGFIVNVEVSSSINKRRLCSNNGLTISGEDGASQGVLGSVVAQLKCLLELGIVLRS
jgi:hypothetical protein